VLVLVDGIPMSDAQSGHFDLDLTVPLELVERIEVVRGPASSLYGSDAMGGVVNVVTRRGDGEPAATVRLEGGSFGTLAGAASAVLPLGGSWSASLSAERNQADGHREGIDHESTLAHATLSGPLGSGRLHLTGGWAARDFGADGFYGAFPSYEETRARLMAAGWRGPLTESVELETRVYARAHDDDFVLRRADPSFYRNLHEGRQEGVEATVLVGTGPGLSLAVGGQFLRDDLASTNLGDHVEDRGGGYLEAAWVGQLVQLRGGVRVEGRDGFGSWVAPSLSASARMSPAVRVRAGIGRSYRTPTFTERYYEDPANVGQADLDPESAWSVEAGLDWALGAGAILRTTVYRRAAEDLVDWARPVSAPTEVPWETRNVESATFHGLEVDLERVPLRPGFLEGSASLLTLNTEEAAGLESKVALRPLNRDVMVGAGLPLGPASVRVRVRALRREGGEAYTLGEARLAAPVLGGEIWVDLTNAWDTEYPDITGLPAAGRALRVGVRMPLLGVAGG